MKEQHVGKPWSSFGNKSYWHRDHGKKDGPKSIVGKILAEVKK